MEDDIEVYTSTHGHSKPIAIVGRRIIPEDPGPTYLSVTDPIGELAFKPSPTKSTPIWMRFFSGYTTKEKDVAHLEISSTSLPTNSNVAMNNPVIINSVHDDSIAAPESPTIPLQRQISHSVPTKGFLPSKLDPVTGRLSLASARFERIESANSRPPEDSRPQVRDAYPMSIQTRKPSHPSIEDAPQVENFDNPPAHVKCPSHLYPSKVTFAASADSLTTLLDFPVHEIPSEFTHHRRICDTSHECLKKESEGSGLTKESNNTHNLGTSAASPTSLNRTSSNAAKSSIDSSKTQMITGPNLRESELRQQKLYPSQIPRHEPQAHERMLPSIRRRTSTLLGEYRYKDWGTPKRKDADESRGNERGREDSGQMEQVVR